MPEQLRVGIGRVRVLRRKLGPGTAPPRAARGSRSGPSSGLRVLAALGVAVVLTHCSTGPRGRTADGGDPDGGAEGDGAADGSGPVEGVEVLPTSPPGGGAALPDGPIVADGPEHDYGPPGRSPLPIAGHISAAFSGAIYALVAEPSGNEPGVDEMTVLLLEPRGGALRPVWLDRSAHLLNGRPIPSLCWTGESFLALLPTESSGLRLLAVGEDGTVLRYDTGLDAELSEVPWPSVGSGTAVVACPAAGGLVAAAYDAAGRGHVLPLGPRGASVGHSEPADLLGVTLAQGTCTRVGVEAACAGTSGVAFVGGAAGVRRSEAVGMEGDPSNLAVVAYSDAVGALWTLRQNSKEYLAFVSFALSGDVTVPPLYVVQLEEDSVMSTSAATDGSSILAAVVYDFEGTGEQQLALYALDLRGALLDGPIYLDTRSVSEYPDHYFGVTAASVHWEGDAFGVLWGYVDDPRLLAYRRIRIEG